MSAAQSPVLQALTCPSCASNLRAEDFDAARGWVKCSYCQALMTMPGQGARQPEFRPRPEAPLPPRVTLEKTERGIEIRRRWFTPTLLFLVFFCVVWDGFLVFFYSRLSAGDAPLFALLFPLVHVVVGLALTYSTLAGLFNTTYLRVERGQLTIAHRPLPWLGNRTLEGRSIQQLYCKERIHRGKRGTHSTYEVWVALADGRSSRLTAAGDAPETALYLEQQIERALGLDDRPVAGELAR